MTRQLRWSIVSIPPQNVRGHRPSRASAVHAATTSRLGAILHPHDSTFKQQRPLPQRGTCQTAHDRTGVSDFPQKSHGRHVLSQFGVCRLQRLLTHTRCMSTVAPRCQGADKRVQTGQCRETEWLAAHLVHAEALANTPQLRHIFRHLLYRLRLVRQQLPLCKSIHIAWCWQS